MTFPCMPWSGLPCVIVAKFPMKILGKFTLNVSIHYCTQFKFSFNESRNFVKHAICKQFVLFLKAGMSNFFIPLSISAFNFIFCTSVICLPCLSPAVTTYRNNHIKYCWKVCTMVSLNQRNIPKYSCIRRAAYFLRSIRILKKLTKKSVLMVVASFKL